MAQLPGGAPPQQAQQQQAPPQQQGAQPPAIAPNAPPVGGDQQAVMQVLEQAVGQAVDQEGFVDMNRLIEIWPTIAQQAGVNVPFETVIQMITQNPELLNQIIQSLGLSGIVKDGQRIDAAQLEAMATGGGL